ncbi:hypothetical protein P7K49_005501, partial [Saguinus oedipus]
MAMHTSGEGGLQGMFKAQRQGEPGAQNLRYSKSPALGKSQWPDLSPFAKSETGELLSTVAELTHTIRWPGEGRAQVWEGGGVYSPETREEMKTSGPHGLSAPILSPGVWWDPLHFLLQFQTLELQGAEH